MCEVEGFLSKLEKEGNFCSLIKNIYDISKAKIMLNGEILHTFLLRSGTRQRYLLLSF